MERLVAETEVKTEVEVKTENIDRTAKQEVVTTPQIVVQEMTQEKTTDEVPPKEYKTEYLKSFEDMTLADMINKDEVEKQKEIQKEKEQLIEQQYTQEEKQEEKIIEKPNFDLIEPDKRVIKLRRKQEKIQPRERKKSKKFGIALAIGLGIASVLCVTNVTILESYSSSLSQLETEFYEVNLPKYLKDVANLDTTKKSMEFLDTYPEEINQAGELGTKTNWFDKFCNFWSGLFGG